MNTSPAHETDPGLVDPGRHISNLMFNLPGMAYRCRSDARRTMEFVSHGCFDLTGYAPHDIVNNSALSFYDIIHRDDRPRVEAEIRSSIERRVPFSLEYRLITRSGNTIWVLERGTQAEAGPSPALEGFILNDNERKIALAHLAFRAHYDELTRLPNRRLALDQLTAALHQARARGTSVGLLRVDIGNLKGINELLGHAAGDRVLVETARRLAACASPSDTVSRLEGDEFLIILPDKRSYLDAEVVARHVIQAVSQPLVLDQQTVHLTPSIGLAAYPDHAPDSESLLRHADAAMHTAKRRGSGTYQIFTPGLKKRIEERVQIEGELHRALTGAEFSVVYQPQIDILAMRLVGVEALLRWNHPRMGAVSPAKFIPIAAETGLIDQIGRWVLGTACRDMAGWNEQFRCSVRIAVNISARQLAATDFAETVERILAQTALRPDLLELEITEGVVMDHASTTHGILQALRDIGVRFSIDDFGTGYSSMAYLKRFFFDSLKIDQSFVRDLPDNKDSAHIARAIVALGNSLGREVVAEGVEEKAHVDFLRDCGCCLAQGYYLGRPIAGKELGELFSSGRYLLAA